MSHARHVATHLAKQPRSIGRLARNEE